MRIAKKHRMDLATTKETTSYVICDPWLRTTDDGPCVYATDGRIAVRVPVQIDADDADGCVPSACFKAPLGARAHERRIDCRRMATLHGKNGALCTHDRPEGRVPDLDELIDNAVRDGGRRLAIDVAALSRVAAALGVNSLMLYVPDDRHGDLFFIGVAPLDGRGEIDGIARGVVLSQKYVV